MIGGSCVVEPHDHIVNLYDDDEHLVTSVAQFVSGAIRAGDVAVVVATQAHRDAIEVRLRREGIDCERLRKSGHYLPFDAAEMLSSISDGTELDADRFEAAVGGLLDRLLARGCRVRAFGEMVALLWEAGNVAGAIELESLWNALARTRRFSLYSAYPMASLAAGGDVTATSQLCEHHSYVLAPRSYESPRPSRRLVDDSTERSELFVPVVSAVAAARRFVRETLAAWDANDLVSDATLIASEPRRTQFGTPDQRSRSPSVASTSACGSRSPTSARRPPHVATPVPPFRAVVGWRSSNCCPRAGGAKCGPTARRCGPRWRGPTALRWSDQSLPAAPRPTSLPVPPSRTAWTSCGGR